MKFLKFTILLDPYCILSLSDPCARVEKNFTEIIDLSLVVIDIELNLIEYKLSLADPCPEV